MPMTMLALRGRAAAKSPLEDATDFLMDAKFQVQQMDDLKNEVEELKPKIDAGEEEARSILSSLKNALGSLRKHLSDAHSRDLLT